MAQYRELVKSWSVDELLDKENELDAMEDAIIGDDDVLGEIREFRLAVIEEMNSRNIFDARDYEEYDAWQGYEEPEDEPDFEPIAYEAPVSSGISREEYLDWLEEKQAIEGPVEWF